MGGTHFLGRDVLKRYYAVNRQNTLFLSESSRLVRSFREGRTHTMASNSLSMCRKQLKIRFKDNLTSDQVSILLKGKI